MPRRSNRNSIRGVSHAGIRKPSPSTVSTRSTIRSRSSSPVSRQTSLGFTTPDISRCSSPLGRKVETTASRRSASNKSQFVSLLAPVNDDDERTRYVINNDKALSTDDSPPTLSWDRATAVVSSQKIQRTVEKPTYSHGTKFDDSGKPIEGTGRVLSYGKVHTKIVTVTVSTTLANTEILHHWEPGYENSRERQRSQTSQYLSTEFPSFGEDCSLNVFFDTEGHDDIHKSHHEESRIVPLPDILNVT